ncbi:nuclear exosome regulator NRDE2, partial [Lecanoromycetidae sp. Uapishka_2]
MGKDLDQLAQQGSILLWRTWAWELLTVGKTSETLERLAAYGDVRVPSDLPDVPQAENIASKPAVLLRTERALANTRDHMLFLGEYIHASIAMECQIIFAYLRNSQSLPAATLTFQSNLTLLSEGAHSIARECLHQSFARLLHYHATHTSLFKPSDIRALLAESMKEFPQNTIFLSLYAWNEARFRIDDRVRSIVKDVILAKDNTKGKQPESIIPHFFAVYTELHRSVTFGSNASTIRSTFERAVGSTSGMHCAGLWKLYFLFERSRGNIASAKRVFWRGVRACPWAKELYLLAFEGLREVMEDAELRSIYELMVEKELRVHVNLDDIFEEMEERNKGG